MLKYYFKNLLKFIKGKRILITTHDLVDIDGLASCFALKSFLNNYFKNQEIFIYLSNLSRPAQNFLNKFSFKFPNFPISYNNKVNFSLIDIILIVDTNNLNQVKFNNNQSVKELALPTVFIDHHYMVRKPILDSPNLIFENYSSTAEIILELFENYKIPLSIPLKTLLISAIITDSGFFKHSTNQTFHNVSKLLKNGISFDEILFLLRNDIDISEKIANIKGMKRVELIRKNNYLIGVSKVGSYGASVASMLVKLGFDIAIVYSKELNQYKVNTRAKNLVCIETGLNLARILEEISDQYNGNGGGHNGAAALDINVESGFSIKQIIERIKEFL
jgi:nanoRNase/pAp phosphatase (c-di-AMP/oligoRNAs hydrolase)